MGKDVYAAADDEDVAEMDEEAQEMAIEHVRNNPKLLRVLDVDEYAKRIEERVGTLFIIHIVNNNSSKFETHTRSHITNSLFRQALGQNIHSLVHKIHYFGLIWPKHALIFLKTKVLTQWVWPKV